MLAQGRAERSRADAYLPWLFSLFQTDLVNGLFLFCYYLTIFCSRHTPGLWSVGPRVSGMFLYSHTDTQTTIIGYREGEKKERKMSAVNKLSVSIVWESFCSALSFFLSFRAVCCSLLYTSTIQSSSRPIRERS